MPESLSQMLLKAGASLPSLVEAAKAEIDEESQRVLEKMRQGTPVSDAQHPHLVDTLTIRKYAESSRKYGYRIDYEGYDENGFPYSEKARVLNKLPSPHAHFIDDAVALLKGMDERIAKRCEKILDEAFEG